MNQDFIFAEPDQLMRLTLNGGEARVLMCRTTRMAQEACDIHQASDTAACAMGRLLSVSAMMGGLIKERKGRLTVSVSGDGAGGKMSCCAQDGRLKIACQNPQAELPNNSRGNLDVAGFVGKQGQIVVVKDFDAGEPYTSISAIQSGELGDDFAHYFTFSEQVPSIVALGCLNQDGVVLSAGGILIQALPGCSEKTIQMLEDRIPFYSGISREIYDRPLRGLAEAWFRGLDPVFLGEDLLGLQCDCSALKMQSALLALGRDELMKMADKGEKAEMTCHYCRETRCFSPETLRELAEKIEKEG